MRIAHKGRVAVLLVVSLLGAGWITAPPASAAAPALEVVIDAEPGDLIGQGKQAAFTAPTSTVVASSTATSIQITADNPTCSAEPCHFVLKFGTTGSVFVDDTWYENAVKTATAENPQLDVSTSTDACTTTNGRFFVDEVEYDLAESVVTQFVARFEQHCNGDPVALFGAVSFNGAAATADWYSRTVAPDPLDFGGIVLGQSDTQTITIAKRDNAASFAPTGMTLTGSSAFTIVSENCTAAPIVTCDVQIKFSPTQGGTAIATLNWKDELAPAGPVDAPATMGTGRDVRVLGTGTTSQLTVSRSGDFDLTRAGTLGRPINVVATNTGTEPVTIDDVVIAGTNPTSFMVDDACDGAELEAAESCTVKVTPYPTAGGVRRAKVRFMDDAAGAPHDESVAVFGTMGYFLAESDGKVTAFGDADHAGDMSGASLNGPVLGITGTRTGDGYWMVGSDGGVFSFGDARFHGSTGGRRLNAPVLALDATADDGGYWMVALDGGIFSFGNATFHGSMGGQHLNEPVVGMAATPDGSGYWLVAEDGGIFAFNAPFKGSMGGKPLNQPIVGMVPTVTGQGYWLIALDGGVFAFGDAAFVGSMGGKQLDAPVVSIAPTATGFGYWMVNTLGEVFPFGDAAWFGDRFDDGVDDVMAITATAPFVDPAKRDGPSKWPTG